MALIQQTVATGNGGATLSLTGVADGHALVVAVSQNGSASRTYSASSDINGALTPVVAYNPSVAAAILVLHGASAGNHTITVSANTGTVLIEAWLFEVSDLDALASPIIPAGDGYSDPSNTDDHYCADASGIDTTTPAFVVAVAALVSISGVSDTTAGSGYVKALDASTLARFCQYQDAASSLTDDRGAWHSAGTDRTSHGTMAAFPVASGGGGDTTLGADLSATSTTAGDLATAIALAAAPQATATLGATLTTELSLAASLSAGSTCAGALETAVTAATALTAAATVGVTLTTAVALATDLTTTSTVTGALETALSLSSALAATSSLAADLATDSTLATAMGATSTLTAALATELSLAAGLTNTADVTADLTTAVTLGAAWSSAATLSADLTAGAGLASGLTSTTTLSGALATQITGAAAWSAASSLSASLTTALHLSAAWTAEATLAGDLAAVSLAPESVPFRVPADSRRWRIASDDLRFRVKGGHPS